MERKVSQRRAWAKAIIGCLEVFPSENPEIEKCSNTVSGIAKFLLGMWVNRQDDYTATGFCADWMDELDEHGCLTAITNDAQWKQVSTRLDSEFMQSTDTQPVIVGQYTLKVERKEGTKNKLHFVIGEAKEGVEE